MRSAAGFHDVMMPSGSVLTIASFDDATIADSHDASAIRLSAIGAHPRASTRLAIAVRAGRPQASCMTPRRGSILNDGPRGQVRRAAPSRDEARGEIEAKRVGL